MGQEYQYSKSMFKQFSILLILLAFNLTPNCFAQEAAIQLPHGNFLFVGVESDIKVVLSNVAIDRVIIKTSDNLLITETDSSNTIVATERGKGVIHVGYTKKRDTIWVDSLTLELRSLPKPKALWGVYNSETTISRDAIAIQRRLRIHYDLPGIVIKQSWDVVSYRVYVFDALSQRFFYCKGAGIPDSVSQFIHNNARGKILIDQIVVKHRNTGGEKWLSPILLYVSQSYQNDSIRYVNATIKTKNKELHKLALIKDDLQINEIFETVDSGIISTFGQNYRVDHYYLNGKKYHKNVFNELGQLNVSMARISDQQWVYKIVNTEGTPILKTTINDTLKFIGTNGLLSLIDHVGLPNPDNFDYELVAFYHKTGLTPIDSFAAYYDEGQIKIRGMLAIRKWTKHYINGLECGNIAIEDYPTDIVVMHGTWTYYDETGKVIVERVYNLGKLVEE